MSKDKIGVHGTDAERSGKAAKAPRKASISEADFLKAATPQLVKLGELSLGVASPRIFSSGSYGWGCNGKVVTTVGGQPVEVQVGLNITVIGSKNK